MLVGTIVSIYTYIYISLPVRQENMMLCINMYKLRWINPIVDTSVEFICELMKCLEPAEKIAESIKGWNRSEFFSPPFSNQFDTVSNPILRINFLKVCINFWCLVFDGNIKNKEKRFYPLGHIKTIKGERKKNLPHLNSY